MTENTDVTADSAGQTAALRQTLSDEMHARAFNDFEGAGRFVRFVFLTDDADGSVLDYVNAFLVANGATPIDPGWKFQRIELGAFALRLEKHTEFVSISFIEHGYKAGHGLLPNAFDAAKVAIDGSGKDIAIKRPDYFGAVTIRSDLKRILALQLQQEGNFFQNISQMIAGNFSHGSNR